MLVYFVCVSGKGVDSSGSRPEGELTVIEIFFIKMKIT